MSQSYARPANKAHNTGCQGTSHTFAKPVKLTLNENANK